MKLPFGFEIVRRASAQATPKVEETRKRRALCKNGHKKDAANTVHVGGQDRCRKCYMDYNARKRAERAAK